MRLLVIPTTDWTGHPVPNRLNFVFDRLAERHEVDVCHFKLFEGKRRDTKCRLISMDKKVESNIENYYLKNFWAHGDKIKDIIDDYDAVISANLIPGYFASLHETPVIFDYLDHMPESAAAYFSRPMNVLAKSVADRVSRFNLKKAAGIITPTVTFQEYLKGITDSPVKVVPNGVDTQVIHEVDPEDIERRYDLGHPVLGYVGSLENWVDLDFVVDLFPVIQKRYKNVKLLVIGPGLHTDYAERLREKVEEMNLSDSIIFVGQVPYEHLPPYISAMDVGLNPRKDISLNRMTMGSKALTYLACGVPVLSTNMPEIEDRFGKNEGVFKYSSEEEFMGELHKAISKKVDPDVVSEYDWDHIAERYEEVIQEFLE